MLQVADRKLKISVLGHPTCGKRAFVERLVHGTYKESCAPMMGTDVSILRSNHGGRSNVWLFWVHAGNENFRKISINTIINSDAVILCIDPSEKDLNIMAWVEEMRQEIIERTAAPIFIVFTKFDELETRKRLQALPDQLQGIHYLAITSAKNGTGFGGLLDRLYEQIHQYRRPTNRYLLSNERTPLIYHDEVPTESEGCCTLQ